MKMQVQQNTANAGWYIGYTNSDAEKNVITKMTEMGYESFAPFRKEVSEQSQSLVETPLFPNYVFIKVATDTLEKNLLKVEGLSNYVYFDGHPAKISEQEIELIRSKVDKSVSESKFSCD